MLEQVRRLWFTCSKNRHEHHIDMKGMLWPYILELLKAGMIEVHPSGEGDVRDDVLVVCDAEGAQFRC